MEEKLVSQKTKVPWRCPVLPLPIPGEGTARILPWATLCVPLLLLKTCPLFANALRSWCRGSTGKYLPSPRAWIRNDLYSGDQKALGRKRREGGWGGQRCWFWVLGEMVQVGHLCS